jgi:hypothetical protein
MVFAAGTARVAGGGSGRWHTKSHRNPWSGYAPKRRGLGRLVRLFPVVAAGRNDSNSPNCPAQVPGRSDV